MKALVTGSSGFLGRHLCRELEKRGWEVGKINSKTPNDAWQIKEYDFIFHLAAETQAGDWCLTHSGQQWLANQEINLRALRWWYLHSPNAKLITIGSSCAYSPGLTKEEDYMKGEPHESLYTYAMTKRMLYEGCRALNKQYGMKYLYLVPSTLYGPDYHTDGRQAHFIFDLIRKIIRGKELGESVVLWGDGYQTREILYVEDFVSIILWCIDKGLENKIFNVGENKSCDLRTYANLICSIVEYNKKDLIWNVNAFTGVKDKVLESLQWEHDFMPLYDGLKKTIDWYYETGAWK